MTKESDKVEAYRESLKNQSISEATHRYQDLVPAFLDILDNLDPDAVFQFKRNYPELEKALENDDHEFWSGSNEEANWLIEELFEELNIQAPENFCFGAHPGDGACYGFWGCQD